MNKEEIKDSYLSTDDISKMSDEDLCEKYLNVQGEGTLEDYCKLDDELKKRLSNSNNKVEDFGKGTIKVLPKELKWLDVKQKAIQEYKKKLVEEIDKFIENYPILEFKKSFKTEIVNLINKIN